MSTPIGIEELEASLHSSLDRATLEKYSDALQAKGDPRGEIIAIDLQIDVHGATPELSRRRRDRLVTWLGTDAIANRRWNPARFKYCLFDDYGAPFASSNAKYIKELYASKAARYLRGVSMRSASLSPDEFDRLVQRPHPWLRRLELNQFWSHAPSKAWHEAFARMTPHLEELSLTGRGPTMDGTVHFTIAHPNVRRIVLEGNPIDLSQSHLPAVVEADVKALDRDLIRYLPALRQLDLSRCDAWGAPYQLQSIPEQIERVRFPAPRTPQMAERVRAFARERGIAIELVHAYDHHAHTLVPLGEPNVREPEPYPWPPRDALSHEQWEATVIVSLRDKAHFWVSLKDFILVMESSWARLDPTARAAWRSFWSLVPPLLVENRAVQRISAGAFRDAVHALDDERFTGALGYEPDTTESWGELAFKLRTRTRASDELAFTLRP